MVVVVAGGAAASSAGVAAAAAAATPEIVVNVAVLAPLGGRRGRRRTGAETAPDGLGR